MSTSKRWAPECKRIYDSQPSLSVNNARTILREDYDRAFSWNHISAANYLNSKYNYGLDPDRTAKDYGDPPEHNEEHYN